MKKEKQTHKNEWEEFLSINHMAFGLDKRSVEQPTIIDKLTKSYPLSINLVISQLTYIYFSVKMSAFDLFLNLLQEDDIFKTNDQNKSIFIEVFSQFLLNKNTQESYYILENMIEYNLIDSKIIQKKFIPYFVHYKSKEEIINDNENYIFFHHIIENYDELSKNDWELHKKYIKEGHNPNEIAKIIRNDEIEKLQEISTQNNFDFNQKIVPSLYERCDFINQRNVTLINYSAFFGSVKSFKYLLMNGAKLDKTGKYAIAGGNIEIVHLCEQNHSAFEDSYEIAIKFHRNDIFTYIYEKNIEGTKNLEQLGSLCILYNNFEVFSFLIEEGMKINDCIINEAAKMGNMFLVKYFLVKNDISKNMLVYSSESGNIELVRYVLDQKGIDINAKDENGNTAIMLASQKGYTEIVKLLLDQNEIDINAKNINENTALIYASFNGNVEIVELLLKQEGIDVNAKEKWIELSALAGASQKGYTEIVKLLLEQKDIDINDKNAHGNTALMNASHKGYIEIVKLLLKQKDIDINAINNIGSTALMQASEYGYTEIVKLFLKQKGIDVNIRNEDEETALIIASLDGRTETVKLLLERKGIDINAKEKNGKTALIAASENGHIEVIKLLLKQEGIDVNVKDDYGFTAIMYPAQTNYIEIVQLFLKQIDFYIDVNAKNDYGATALMLAIDNGNIKIVKLLLEQKSISVNDSDDWGDTPLIYASQNNRIEIVKLLLEHKGINVNAKNNEGKTALMVASENGYTEIVQLIGTKCEKYFD